MDNIVLPDFIYWAFLLWIRSNLLRTYTGVLRMEPFIRV